MPVDSMAKQIGGDVLPAKGRRQGIALIDDAADRYVPANNVTSFDSVISLRVSLLFRTTDAAASVLKDTSTYDLIKSRLGSGIESLPVHPSLATSTDEHCVMPLRKSSAE